ncbi:MAG: 3-deoxy-manno-octulosonate cytidylyltransferase [Candidatus Omnitrophica bacterium]|nr:3-deoxy-manno-octulosonate cytidylyltransferase [Candidatus Omnitrophota bacterium]HOX54640.1 3-deoxy-manno-octulosonate cytidylyltransferase [Candidatus Omnitrophota bacterium]
MNIVGIIPARYASTRLEAKVLADILGKPMIQHVWERAKQSKMLDDLIIACDDERVKEVAEGFGAKAILTSKDHESGSDRLTEIVHSLDVKAIINIQGDEPLIHSTMIDNLAHAILDDESVVMATIIKKIENKEEIDNPNVVKVIIDRNDFAIYFSRSRIPYLRDKSVEHVYYKHMGIYAYTKDFLFTFKNLPESKLEKAEKLEQLRALEAGYKIKTVETNIDTIAVDTAEDLELVKERLSEEKTD